MKPIKFEESNAIYSINQKEYLLLHACQHRTPELVVTSCWQLSLAEKIKLLWTGKIWLSLLTFNQPLQPQLLSTNKPRMDKL